ncbi:complement C1q-like protein 4 [Polymixia lowei]
MVVEQKVEMRLLERTVQDLKTELQLYKDKADNLEKNLAGENKVAFSVALTEPVGPVSVETTLIYPSVISNVGNAYNSITGIFTAPVTGAYFFRFNAMDNRIKVHMGVTLYKNNQKVLHDYAWNHWEDHEHVSNGVVLELSVGDVVYMRIPPTYRLFDFDNHNFNIFSGFLLFPM